MKTQNSKPYHLFRHALYKPLTYYLVWEIFSENYLFQIRWNCNTAKFFSWIIFSNNDLLKLCLNFDIPSFSYCSIFPDQLKKADQARIIFVGSILAHINNLSVNNLVESTSYIVGSGFNYSNSKYCNILAAQEFGSKLKKYNIMVYSADPGIIRTKIFKQKKRWLDIVNSAMLWFLGNVSCNFFHVGCSFILEILSEINKTSLFSTYIWFF